MHLVKCIKDVVNEDIIVVKDDGSRGIYMPWSSRVILGHLIVMLSMGRLGCPEATGNKR